jgi:hypothetical protein
MNIKSKNYSDVSWKVIRKDFYIRLALIAIVVIANIIVKRVLF